MYPKFSLILIALFLSFVAKAQIWDYSYTHYGKEDGLPSNTVYCMVEDKDGIMWIGTDAGLVRFDGSHFKTYTTADGLPSNDVFSLFCDSKNRVWIGGLSPYISFYQNQEIKSHKNSEILNKIELQISPLNFFEDDSNAVWVSDVYMNLHVINKNNDVRKIHVDNSENQGFNYIKIDTIAYFFNLFNTIQINLKSKKQIRYSNKNHKYLINSFLADNKFIVTYSVNDNKLKKFPYKKLTNNEIGTITTANNLIKEKSNYFYKIENQGVSYYNMNNLKFIHRLLNFVNVSNVLISKEFTFFTTLNDGIYLKKNSNSNNLQIINTKKGEHFFSVKKNKNELLAGNSNNEIYIIKDGKIKKYCLDKKYSNISRVLKIINASGNYIISDNGFYKHTSSFKKLIFPYNKNTNFSTACKNVFFLKNNSEIILLNNVGILKFNVETHSYKINYLKKRLYSYHSFQGKEIIGAEDGLYYLKNDSLIPYPLNIPFHVRVMEITSKDSFLIVATINKGIFVINNHHVVANIDKSVGLSSNCCFRIKHYKDNLVIATNNGINFYNYTQHAIGKVFESDGLASNVVNDIDIDADTLYAATENGLSSIIIPEINFNKNFTIFSKPTIINRDSIWTKDSVFHTRTNYAFNFMLHSLTFGTKGNVKFYYQVDNPNVENGFIETSDQFIRFKFPKPGLYPINIYAKDVNDNISKQLKFLVYVDPYFSQTKTYYVVLIFTALVISSILYYAIYRYMKFRDGIQGVQKELIQKLQLKSWQSQMNPHYLFNSLNALQYMFLSSDADQAKDFMMNFSTMLRKTIDQSKQMFTTVEIEIQYIEGYLNLEREKRKQPFDYQIVVSNQSIYKLNIPTLLIQPVLENSIKHGINFRPDGLIMIHFSIENDWLTVSIQDNGSGLQPKPQNPEHQSIGLKLIQDKIEIVENYIQDKIFYSLENKIENGKVIGAITIFKFPLNLHNK